MHITSLDRGTVAGAAKWTFAARRVRRSDVARLVTDVAAAVSGDLVLGQILEIGQHKKVQLAEGRFSTLYPGDHIVAACGDRYAPDQFEAVAELAPEAADLVAGGGLVGRMRAAHARMAPPTRIQPLGLLADASGEVINVAHYSLPTKRVARRIALVGCVGTSMNAGKTTAVASLGHGLGRAGYRVAAIKATGTGAFGDVNAFRDAGIPIVVDFTDAGMASTYRQPLERIERGFESLVAHVADEGAEVAVVELADGVFQLETAALLRESVVRERLDGIMFAAPDALSAVGGVTALRQIGIAPFAVSGMVSCSPLAAAEARAAIDVPIVSREELMDPGTVTALLDGRLPRAAAAGALAGLKPAA